MCRALIGEAVTAIAPEKRRALLTRRLPCAPAVKVMTAERGAAAAEKARLRNWATPLTTKASAPMRDVCGHVAVMISPVLVVSSSILEV